MTAVGVVERWNYLKKLGMECLLKFLFHSLYNSAAATVGVTRRHESYPSLFVPTRILINEPDIFRSRVDPSHKKHKKKHTQPHRHARPHPQTNTTTDKEIKITSKKQNHRE